MCFSYEKGIGRCIWKGEEVVSKGNSPEKPKHHDISKGTKNASFEEEFSSARSLLALTYSSRCSAAGDRSSVAA